jgi:hypothetical protein
LSASFSTTTTRHNPRSSVCVVRSPFHILSPLRHPSTMAAAQQRSRTDRGRAWAALANVLSGSQNRYHVMANRPTREAATEQTALRLGHTPPGIAPSNHGAGAGRNGQNIADGFMTSQTLSTDNQEDLPNLGTKPHGSSPWRSPRGWTRRRPVSNRHLTCI